MTTQVEATQAVSSTITVETLPVLTWNNQAVITTEFLAAVYGASEKQIRQNINNNQSRFFEGVHFFKIVGDDLRDFKNNCVSKRDLVENNEVDIIDFVGKNASHLTLWTERGTIRHAKILETEQAWAVQEKLEDCYFAKAVNKRKKVNPMGAINAEPKHFFSVTDEQKKELKEMVLYFCGHANKNKRFDGLTEDRIMNDFVLNHVGASSLDELNLKQYEMAINFLDKSFANIMLRDGGRITSSREYYFNSPVANLPIVNGQVTINSVPNVRYLVEQDEHGNASIRAIKHNEQICSREQAIKDLVGEGRVYNVTSYKRRLVKIGETNEIVLLPHNAPQNCFKGNCNRTTMHNAADTPDNYKRAANS